MKIHLKLAALFLIMLPILSGCHLSDSNIEIQTEDIVIEVGQQLDSNQVIDAAIIDINTSDPFSSNHTAQLKGLDNIDWNTPNSYKLTYQVCVSDHVCESEDFELNIVTDISSEQAVEMVRRVYVTAHGLDVPINNRLSEQQILSEATVQIIDSDDGSFKRSLSISGFEAINWNKAGEYNISIGGCDSELNCDETDTTIHIRDDIDRIQIHND